MIQFSINTFLHAPAALAIAVFLPASCGSFGPETSVRFWEEDLILPTYLAAPPSPVPRFYEGRTYQGARAALYPYPVQDVLTDTRVQRSYKALFLENRYVKICVIPELGGRLFSATDKGNGYDFFYRQHVVKPALIGMLGAWISGGVEWNVPHHHRATSFMPVASTVSRNADGSATIWVGELELRHRMRWLVGMTLFPDRSYLELTGIMINVTPFAHPMLFWINAAVHANEDYQVVFPPSTEWVTQHSKPEFASWPIAKQAYGGTDYTAGVDISWWKNHPSPVSFFAWEGREDWFGGYDHGRRAGVLHWADRHVVPGKKFFEWGIGPEGGMWSRMLTDEDGPYLELMAGAWSDNQPDYSWIQPGETREWKHWWYPIRELGGVKAATRDAAVNLEVSGRTAVIALNATRELEDALVKLEIRRSGPSRPASGEEGPETLLLRSAALGPAKPFRTEIPLVAGVGPEALRVSLHDAGGRELVAWQGEPLARAPMPRPVERPKPPKECVTADALFYTGQRIEQLLSPSFAAAPYYEEMLRRDPGDCRGNTALGILLCKQWRWAAAIERLQKAIAVCTAGYIRPKECEAFYYLGVALRATGKLDQAYDAFKRATWSPAWRPAAGVELGEIDLLRGKPAEALAAVDLALSAAGRSLGARHLKATVLRRLGRPREAREVAVSTLEIDPLDLRAGWEHALARRQEGDPTWRRDASRLRERGRGEPEAFRECALAFARAGQWNDMVELMHGEGAVEAPALGPSGLYLLAFALGECGRGEEAAGWFAAGARGPVESCFPFRFEEEPILRRAMAANPKDANAAYLLGCLLYDNRPEDAIAAWEAARRRDDRIALVHRNLGLAYAQHEKDIPKAIASLESAVRLDPREPRFLYELDVFAEAGGVPVARRLEVFEKHPETAAWRDDALARRIDLLTAAGAPDRALALLLNRHFHSWEGSAGVRDLYVDARLARGRNLFADRRYSDALVEFTAALEYPENLEVGRPRRDPRAAQVHFAVGTAHEALGDLVRAKEAFERALAGEEGAASPGLYYKALGRQKLGRPEEAIPLFDRLVKAGGEELARTGDGDWFAKFGERGAERVRKANANYLVGLGLLGRGEAEEAAARFRKALELHPAHLGAAWALAGP